MKYTAGALTLFLAGASAFSPAAQHSTRYDHGKELKKQHITLRLHEVLYGASVRLPTKYVTLP